MKKCLFVIPSLSKGGAERVVCVLASGLVNIGYDITVLRYFKTEADYPIDQRVKIITLSEGFEEDYKKIKKSDRNKRIRKIIEDVSPDRIIPFLRHVNLQVYLSCGLKYKSRVIFTIRDNPKMTKPRFEDKLHEFLINNTNKTIVQNNAQKEYFKKSAAKRIHIVPNPVNQACIELESNPSTNIFNIVAAGRLSKGKNFEMLIKAFSDFAKDKNDVLLSIYGEGALKESLQELINKNDCGNKIKLMGRTNDLNSVYTKASLFVLSSRREGMPNVLLEAMAVGVPCISTNCPTGPSEMIVDEENGLLVPVDDEEKMSQAINYMYKNYDKAKLMGKNAKNYVLNNYKLEIVLKKFVDVIEL